MAQLEDGRGVNFSSEVVETETRGTDLAHGLTSVFRSHACFIVDEGSIECEDVASSPGSTTSIVGAHEFIDIMGSPIQGVLCGLDTVGDIHCYEWLNSTPSASLIGHGLWGMAGLTFRGPMAAGRHPRRHRECAVGQECRNAGPVADVRGVADLCRLRLCT